MRLSCAIVAIKRTRRALSVAIAAAASLGLLAGCGSGSGSAGSESAGSGSPGPGATAQHTSTSAAAASTAAAPVSACDAPTLLDTLDTRERLAQLITVGVTGTADAVAVMRAEQIGGIFVSGGTANELLQGGVEQIDTASAIPPLVSIDEEGGRVARIPNLIGRTPSAREVVATMTPRQAQDEAFDRATKLRAMGVTVDFAPDVDVSAQPDDAVIGDRSYSDDPAVVTAYGTAFATGMRDAGVFPVIKHFPGHGSSSGDSHTGAVTVPPLDQLQVKDLVPFREMIANFGTGTAVMVGHLDVPGLTSDGLPASVSPAVMALLRDGAGYDAPPFDGVIFTDDLSGMAAITDRFTLPQSVVAALTAGADVALWGSTDRVPEVLDALEAAVASGQLPMEQVDASVQRVLELKAVANCGA